MGGRLSLACAEIPDPRGGRCQQGPRRWCRQLRPGTPYQLSEGPSPNPSSQTRFAVRPVLRPLSTQEAPRGVCEQCRWGEGPSWMDVGVRDGAGNTPHSSGPEPQPPQSRARRHRARCGVDCAGSGWARDTQRPEYTCRRWWERQPQQANRERTPPPPALSAQPGDPRPRPRIPEGHYGSVPDSENFWAGSHRLCVSAAYTPTGEHGGSLRSQAVLRVDWTLQGPSQP